MRAWVAGALSVALATGDGAAADAQRPPLDAVLRSSKGDRVPLSKWRGKPVILFYEDKHSTTLNLRLKEELFARGRQRGLLDSAHVVAVANLEAYNFFPAREIALSYVRDEERKAGVPILVDLEGTLGAPPWSLPRKTSNVLLLDAEGRTLYRHSGRMEEAELEAFFRTLGRLVGVDLGTEPTP